MSDSRGTIAALCNQYSVNIKGEAHAHSVVDLRYLAGHRRPLFAADGDSPLLADAGKSRPLVVIAPSTVDPAWVSLKKALNEPAGKQGFSERNMVLYTVLNTIGQRDGKDLDPQSTMALIRSLKLGAGAQTKIILVGKDGEKKLEHSGAIELKELFDTVDKLPTAEKRRQPRRLLLRRNPHRPRMRKAPSLARQPSHRRRRSRWMIDSSNDEALLWQGRLLPLGCAM